MNMKPKLLCSTSSSKLDAIALTQSLERLECCMASQLNVYIRLNVIKAILYVEIMGRTHRRGQI